jgi:hypothetical protein
VQDAVAAGTLTGLKGKAALTPAMKVMQEYADKESAIDDYLAKLEAAGLICKPVAESPAFANWWYEEGSGIGPEQFPGRDLCEFVRAVAAIAWANGEYVGRLNKEGGAA